MSILNTSHDNRLENADNLHELINRYEANIDRLYGKEHLELFKWRAMRVWRQEWFKPDDSFDSFAGRFTAAKREFSLFIDNSRMHPSTGVLKLWEKEPDTVERLFNKVLFAKTEHSVDIVQEHMDTFLEEYEALRQRHFPGNWSYKQDRHSASVFLAMNDPEFNYVFKSNEAHMMAHYIGFPYPIGIGKGFSLGNYYRLCDEIVAAIKEHKTLLEKHYSYMTEQYYIDNSLHLLAFDLIYCCRTYNYYKGLIPHTGKKIKRASVGVGLAEEEKARREAERLEKIKAIEQRILNLENSCIDCEDISLLGVQVYSVHDGVGTVIEQIVNKVTVQFEDKQKSFVLDKKYTYRPRFENDEDIIEAFTAYGQAQAQIKELRRMLEALN